MAKSFCIIHVILLIPVLCSNATNTPVPNFITQLGFELQAMSLVKIILEAFSNMFCRHAFDLKDGFHYEGYILQVEDNHLVFGSGGPMADSEDLLIPIDSVDLKTLSFWDEDKKCYSPFCHDL